MLAINDGVKLWYIEGITNYKFMKPVMRNHEVVYELDFLIWRDKIL